MNVNDLDPSRARVFGSVAEEYERWRPGYPDAAIDWLVPEAAVEVADVGAGTGKLTGPLLARGLHVVAIEPDPVMLALLTRLHPQATACLAAAEALPIADAGVDAVVVGQAWHWFPPQKAAAEVRRVLRPGGWLGLVWNAPDPSALWERELAGLHPDAALEHQGDDQDFAVPGLPIDELQVATFAWSRPISAPDLRARMATDSAFLMMEAAERERRLDAAAAVVAAEAQRQDSTTVMLGQQAFCVRWQPHATGNV